jgi:hypothetical protein
MSHHSFVSVDERDLDLWWCIEDDRPAELRRMLAAGRAPVYHHFPDGWTPLHHAIDVEGDFHVQSNGRGRLDLRLVGPLLEAGADTRAVWRSETGGPPKTPLLIARDYLHVTAIEAILRASTDRLN